MPTKEPMGVVSFRMPVADLVRFREALAPDESLSNGFREAAELLIAVRREK